jgi:hypothetical protein
VEAPPGPREASLRAAASRAYYAAFHTCREAVEQRNNLTIDRDNIHAQVIGRLRDRAETEATGIALDRLRRTRAHADYNSTRPFSDYDAAMSLQLAVQVLESLGSSL